MFLPEVRSQFLHNLASFNNSKSHQPSDNIFFFDNQHLLMELVKQQFESSNCRYHTQHISLLLFNCFAHFNMKL